MTTALPPTTDRSPAANMQSSRRFLEHATLELSKDPPERLQASEKSWGALSQAVKAVAKDRRWRNDSHFRTHAILNQIIYEQWDETATAEEVRQDFLTVQSLHSNYHENVSDVPTIEVGIRAAQRLVDRLEQVRRDGPRPAVIKDADVQERLAYLLEINQLDQSVIDRVIPIGKRSDDGFKKDGMLGRVVSRVRRGKEIPGSYATSWGMPWSGDDNNRDDTDNGSNPNDDGRGGRPAPRPRPGGQSRPSEWRGWGYGAAAAPGWAILWRGCFWRYCISRGRARVGNPPLAGSSHLRRRVGKRRRQTFR